MDPREYVTAFLEHEYLAEHAGLTDGARELLHAQVLEHPETYATTPQAQSLVSYARTREHLLLELDRMEDLPDDAFDKKREELFNEVLLSLYKICETDEHCVDARLLSILLANVPLDNCLSDLMELEKSTAEYLTETTPGFNAEAPHYWDETVPEGEVALRTKSNPVMIGWLHTVEALSQGCMSSARYRCAETYARRVMRSRGYTNRAFGTLLLAQARLEDEDGFFTTAREGGEELENSPWYLLGRTILLYKMGRRKNAQRAMRDFAMRCDGGAFFVLNPTYLMPYLPVRPEPRRSWDLTHQAVWEADAILVDTPDFSAWAQSIDGIVAVSEDFARRNGF